MLYNDGGSGLMFYDDDSSGSVLYGDGGSGLMLYDDSGSGSVRVHHSQILSGRDCS